MTTAEVVIAAKSLKNDKSNGSNRILDEMLMCMLIVQSYS